MEEMAASHDNAITVVEGDRSARGPVDQFSIDVRLGSPGQRQIAGHVVDAAVLLLDHHARQLDRRRVGGANRRADPVDSFFDGEEERSGQERVLEKLELGQGNH